MATTDVTFLIPKVINIHLLHNSFLGEKMENIFLINTFEEGWNTNDLLDVYSQEAYCIFNLDIPDEKIYGTEILNDGMEVILTDISQSEHGKDWYINLHRICI